MKKFISLLFVLFTTVGLGVSVFAEEVKHKIESGDTLWALSEKYGTTIDALKSANKLDSDLILIGNELIIPSKEDGVKEESKQEEVKGDIFEASFFSNKDLKGFDTTPEGFSATHDGNLVVFVNDKDIPVGTEIKVVFDNGSTYKGITKDKDSTLKEKQVKILTSSSKVAKEMKTEKVTISKLK